MPSPWTVLLALDKFKGCLSAIDVCSELRTGLLAAAPSLEVVTRPMADGGDGTLAAARAAGFAARSVPAAGPLGKSRPAEIGMRGNTALIELAEVCGLDRLPAGSRQPMQTTTYGVGLAMKAALSLGCRALVVGIGGSASTDGGMGAATALGARILDRNGDLVRPSGSGLLDVSTMDFEPMLTLLENIDITLATDVRSPLLGKHGAAQVFAPQKGASPDQVHELDSGLRHWAAALVAATGVDVATMAGVGAAGGFAAPFLATGSALITSGAQLVLDLTGTRSAIGTADVVVTGEGRWDAQTGTGKAPHAVVEAARSAGRPVIGVAGSFSSDADLTGLTTTYSLTELARPHRDPQKDARILLHEIGTRIAQVQTG